MGQIDRTGETEKQRLREAETEMGKQNLLGNERDGDIGDIGRWEKGKQRDSPLEPYQRNHIYLSHQ